MTAASLLRKRHRARLGERVQGRDFRHGAHGGRVCGGWRGDDAM